MRSLRSRGRLVVALALAAALAAGCNGDAEQVPGGAPANGQTDTELPATPPGDDVEEGAGG